jgi:hypothetical protein
LFIESFFSFVIDDGFSRALAFQFLDSIQEKFNKTFGRRAQTALPYGLNTEFRWVSEPALQTKIEFLAMFI